MSTPQLDRGVIANNNAGCYVTKSSSLGVQAVTSSLVTRVALDVVDVGTHNVDGHFSTSTNLYTCPYDGRYRISGQITWGAFGGSSGIRRVMIGIVQSSTLRTYHGDALGVSVAQNYGQVVTVDSVQLSAGDVIDLRAFQTQGVVVNLLQTASNEVFCSLDVTYLGS